MSVLRHIATWAAQSLAALALGIPVKLLGLPLVALGLRFRREYPETEQPFEQHTGTWVLVRLPAWLAPWDNRYDGMMGDKRGYWDNWCRINRGRDSAAFWSMWEWAAIRNPANHFSRNMIARDISGCTIDRLAGNADVVTETPGRFEWHFLRATPERGWPFYRLFFVWPWPFKDDHAVMIDIGWKFKLAHEGVPKDAPEKDRLRGFVFSPSPWKKL